MEGRFVLILALTAAIAGMSTEYSVQEFLLSDLNFKDWTLLATIVTAIVTNVAIILLKLSDNRILPTILTAVALIVWVVYLIIYNTDEKYTKKHNMTAIIYICMCGSTLATYILTGSLTSR